MTNDTKKKSAKVRLEDAFTPKASISKKAYALLAVLSFVLIFLYWAYAVYVKHVDSIRGMKKNMKMSGNCHCLCHARRQRG